MDKYGILNEVLVRLFRDIMDIEEKAIITPEFKDITNNDMHVIEAIGTGAPKKYVLHRQRAVGDRGYSDHRHEQPGEKKGYVVRERGQEDRRVVYISLSDRGRKAFEHHARFHREMIDGVTGDLSEEEMQVLVKALSRLDDWFREKERQNQ